MRTKAMKKYILSFILLITAFASVYADGYTGIMVTDNDGQGTYCLFEERPNVRCQMIGDVMNACIYVAGKTDPVISFPIQNGTKLTASYATFIRVNLNNAGYATFSAKDTSFVATDGVTAYKAKVNGELITLTALEGNIPAGTGVLLYGETPDTTVNLPVATSGDLADVTDNDLKPTTLANGEMAELEPNSWALGDSCQFLRFVGDSYVYNRAYLVHEQSAGTRGLRIIFDEEETGMTPIASPLGKTGEGAAIYNLQGVRLDRLKKGINIVNDKKVIVK